MKIQDRYEYDPNQDLLGRGGFARVYRARDTLLHRDVALKVFSNTGGHRYSVLDEIRKAIGLEHPNLLRYYDVILLEGENNVGEKEQTQIGVMELANAGDLKDFARSNLGSPLLYKLLTEVLQGLEYLHGKGIIHRDLKPQNILLVKQDGQLTAKISDFGISKDTGAGGNSSSMMVGTVEYMAPEQFSPAKYGIDGKVSSNLDLWSFGIMVHELLTDSTPFGSRDGDTTVEQIMAQILSTELPQDIERLPEPYKSVVKKCLVTNARERIRKASELVVYFEGKVTDISQVPEQDHSTKVYPKDGPTKLGNSAAGETDSTKVYPKGGPVAATGTRGQEQATKAYPADKSPASPLKAAPPAKRNKAPLIATALAAALVIGGGSWWYAENKQAKAVVEQAAVEAKVKQEAEAKVAVEKARQEAEMIPGKVFKDCADCPEMVVVPAGEHAMMKSTIGMKKGKQVHTVTFGKPFAMGKTEVTQRQWQDVMGSNPSRFSACDDCPVEKVTWNDAQDYVRKLSQKTDKTYRLPSEAEWEYACRAGGKHAYCGSDNFLSVAWDNDFPTGQRTRPVASKKPNAWGLFDMTGNVFEWLEDCGNPGYIGAPMDGSPDLRGDCSKRLRVGGGWGDGSYYQQLPNSNVETADSKSSRTGFRVARTVQ